MTQHRDQLSSTTVHTPIGELTVIASSTGVRAVLWPVPGEHRRVGLVDEEVVEEPDVDDEVVDELIDGVAGHDRRDGGVAGVLARTRVQLEEYFAGERVEFDVPLDPVGTEFQLAAWDALRSIGYAQTVSYGEQAERMGDRRKARAVGAANGKNPISIIVPCHRVVGGDGRLTGFAGGTETKRWLLDHEARVAGTQLV